jgi:hypothetical protein
MSKLQKKLVHKRENPALLNMKLIPFLTLCVIFALLDPDLDPDPQSGSGSRDPLESGRIRNTDSRTNRSWRENIKITKTGGLIDLFVH